MAQLFRPGANTLVRATLAGIVLVPLLLFLLGMTVVRSGYVTGEGRFVDQPVPFSHQHHAGDVGIDCRYCHTSVETQANAVIPPTKEDLPERRTTAIGTALYWHLVDIVWVILYPLLYLVGRP